MNTNPSRAIDGIKTRVVYMNMKALENQLGKGQKNGDATKVVTSGEIQSIDDLTPRIETSAVSHIVDLNNNCRVLPNGEKVRMKIDKKRRDLQQAIIREQEAILDIDNEK